ncbi:MAG: YraN family protein [Lachnospiraceae bacterium]|nr:YraN family protein [Lachnospiraceae bacterium]
MNNPKQDQQNKRAIGGRQEDLACRFLTQEGLTILERNYRVKIGEIDIIAREGDVICFIEVKYRASKRYGGASYAISTQKQQKIRKVAQWYISSHHLGSSTFFRFDAVLIEGEEIRYIRNAW